MASDRGPNDGDKAAFIGPGLYNLATIGHIGLGASMVEAIEKNHKSSMVI